MDIWIFNGTQRYPGFPSGVFLSLESAEKWIRKNKLNGTLTKYPADTGIYEWSIEHGYFTPKKDEHYQAAFIANFTSASQEHYHYEQGKRDG